MFTTKARRREEEQNDNGASLSHRDDAGNGAFGRDVGVRRFGIRGLFGAFLARLRFSSCLRAFVVRLKFSPTGKPKGK